MSKLPDDVDYRGFTFATKPFDPTTTFVFDPSGEWFGSITAGKFTPAISAAETMAMLDAVLRKPTEN